MPSTAIRHLEYDAARHILSAWFVPTGRRYDYLGVAADLYGAFRVSRSKGRFFNARIRDHFACRLVPDAAAEPNFSTVAEL